MGSAFVGSRQEAAASLGVGDGGEIEASASTIGLVSWGRERAEQPCFSAGKMPRLITSLTD